MRTESSAAQEGTGKQKHGELQGGNPWIGAAIGSILVSSLVLLALHQHLILVVLVAAGLGELARTLSDILDGWNKVTVITLGLFEVAGLTLVGLYHVDGALIELMFLVAVSIINRLRKGDESVRPAEGPQERAPTETVASTPLIPRQVAVTEDPPEAAAPETKTSKTLNSRKIAAGGGLFIVFLISRKKLYQGIKRVSDRHI
ncbi:hypothetical protein OHB05_14200 [Streptomyces sp. NBC_00638]|uniref:hypothetical protein n=1 Tax=Streptomyces sp. NBC_00638 TaxID=2975794 RepID=UPI002255B284|nr:hypothetical protein [Streptomyces sp. NBC_00638]MCX5003775.1 hypothetical protein [Streptomyces sp. NBC_00638]